MLPDYPEIKRKLQRGLGRRFELLIDQKAPHVARIRRIGQAEGDKFTFEDEEGTIVEKGFHRFEGRVEVPIKLPLVEINKTVAKQIEQAAETIAAQSEGLLFTAHKEAVESVGNVFDARGQQYNPLMMWDMIEKVHIDFDENGRPEMGIVVMHPDTLARIRPQIEKWEADPVLKKRRAEVLAKKKEEWRDRESNRTLVG